MTIIPKIVQDPAWYPDSGLTSLVTPNANNLRSMIPYQGNEKVYMKDGVGLTIQHIGNITLISSLVDKLLMTKNLLHVPNMNKNR